MDGNKDAYLEKLSQPILPDNKLEGSAFDMAVQAKKLKVGLKLVESHLVK